MTKVHNFSAGPGILPAEVLKGAAEACINFDNLNLSLLEISHRSKNYEKVMDDARNIIKELFEVGDEYEVIYLGGGASLQFAMVPYNLLSENGYAAYVNTGVWASKAIKEASLIGKTKVIASSEDKKFTYIPKGYEVPADADYLHLTTNNTIYGTQWQDMDFLHAKGVPLVADMSSDILSLKRDFKHFQLIYAGAQKNIGAAGVNLVVVKKEALGKVTRNIPTMLDYRQHIEAGSMLNTPPVFAVYVCLLTLRWLKEKGGVETIEKENNRKAELLYNTIDSLPHFKGTVAKEDRSKMNACFVMDDADIEKEFLELAKGEGMVGIKGHRSVGGFRVSMYNALPYESVVALTDLMTHFSHKKG